MDTPFIVQHYLKRFKHLAQIYTLQKCFVNSKVASLADFSKKTALTFLFKRIIIKHDLNLKLF